MILHLVVLFIFAGSSCKALVRVQFIIALLVTVLKLCTELKGMFFRTHSLYVFKVLWKSSWLQFLNASCLCIVVLIFFSTKSLFIFLCIYCFTHSKIMLVCLGFYHSIKEFFLLFWQKHQNELLR